MCLVTVTVSALTLNVDKRHPNICYSESTQTNLQCICYVVVLVKNGRRILFVSTNSNDVTSVILLEIFNKYALTGNSPCL